MEKYKNNYKNQIIWSYLIAITLCLLFLMCGCMPNKVDTSGKQEVKGEIIIRYVIDLKSTALGLLDVCNQVYANYTGADKNKLLQECTTNQVQQINNLLEGLINQVNALPTPTTVSQ